MCENSRLVNQMKNNTEEQVMLGDFAKVMDDAIFESSAAHENQKMQLLSDPQKHAKFKQLLYWVVKEQLGI